MRALNLSLVLLVTACAAAQSPDAGGDLGGAAGSTANGGIANSSGGATTGGSSTTSGGSPSGGASTGGTSTGGSSMGGASTGGASTGGSSSGDSGNTGGGVTGATGVWEDVTPSGINLSPSFNPADNYGVQDVLADPSHPGRFYAFVCYQGVWKSDDFGSTWVKVDTDNNLEQGRPWGEAIAPDGSYMLACTGYGTARWGAWKSTDGGATWKKYPIVDNSDPYMFDIDPNDKNHVISTSHSVDNVYESKDAGQTWTDQGASGVGASGYAFIVNRTTWLIVAQSGSGGTHRTTNSGASWTQTGPMEHVHGGEQIFIDPSNGHIYVGAHSGSSGIYRSTDSGASFTKVSSAQSAAVFGTGQHLYSMDSGANLGGNPPNLTIATRSDGTNWAASAVPSAMTNGPKRADVALDASSGKWVIVAGNWNAGIWRYIEP